MVWVMSPTWSSPQKCPNSCVSTDWTSTEVGLPPTVIGAASVSTMSASETTWVLVLYQAYVVPRTPEGSVPEQTMLLPSRVALVPPVTELREMRTREPAAFQVTTAASTEPRQPVGRFEPYA